MKLSLVFIAILLFCITGVSASVHLTFQDPGDFAAFLNQYNYPDRTTYVDNSMTCDNSYLHMVNGGGVITNTADPTTYAAITSLKGSTGNIYIVLFDANMNLMQTFGYPVSNLEDKRLEMFVIGGKPNYYSNGVLAGIGADINQNPSYVAFYEPFGGFYADADDMIVGDSVNKNIFDAPATGCYLKKDLVNPAASGLFNATNSLVSSFNMTTRWGKSSISPEGISLYKFAGGVPDSQNTISSGSANTGTLVWDLNTAVFNNPSTQYGYYVVTITNSGSYSTVIPYIASGATISWNSATYSPGDSAIISYGVSAGYWIPAIYSYTIEVVDVYGVVKSSTPISLQSSTVTHSFGQSDVTGVYYAEVVATRLSDNTPILMNFAPTIVTGFITFNGYVNDAVTATPISASIVNVTQGNIVINATMSHGQYTATGFLTGSPIVFNATASGYSPTIFTITLLGAGTIPLNITMVPSSLSPTGVTLYGVTTDSSYNRPIPGVVIPCINRTFTYTTVTNDAGFYRIDNLVSGTLYTCTPSKTGFAGGSFTKAVYGV